MSSNCGLARSARRWALAAAVVSFCVIAAALYAQESSTGNISGTITGPKGASVSGADVTITNRLTGAATHITTSPAGTYAARDLPPGEYVVHAEAKGFQPAELLVRVQAGLTATADIKLQRQLAPAALLVNLETPEVRGALNVTQMEQTPTDRNFLDLTKLEPGVQVLDGQSLAPSKTGSTAASIGARNGRSTRTQVDTLDITDEIIGTNTHNIPVSAIQEVSVSQSLLPLSSGPAAAGLVNVITTSASNDFHGQVFGHFRHHSVGIASFDGQDNSYSREVFGGNMGGALKPDKLFLFLSGEYFKQDLLAPVVFNQPFDPVALGGLFPASFATSFHSPFRETELAGRLDYKLSRQSRLFYRLIYDDANAVNSFPPDNFQVFRNAGHTPSHAVGFDFNQGVYTHSIRFGYNRYADSLRDVVNRAGVFNPAPGTSLDFSGGSGFATGPNPFAPQHTIQSSKEVRYDGGRTSKSHTFHFGVALNRINGLVLADLFGSAPQVGLDTNPASTLLASNGRFPGGAGNPLNYSVRSITLGNGFSCFTEKLAFGSACGGVAGTRFEAYGGDSWKLRPNLTLTYGVQYLRDTGRSDSDLATIPCSAVAASLAALAPCTGSDNLLNHFGRNPGLGDRVRQPNLNFAPQFGLVWAPGKSSRTVIRAGIGLYYDDSLFQNILLDHAGRVASRVFNAQANDPCASHGVVVVPGNVPLTSSDGLDIATQICGNPVGNVATAIRDLQSSYQAASALSSANPQFVGNRLGARGLLAPNFQTPRSVEMNLGFQHQMGQATLVSVDYVRNVGTHYLLGLDTNHVGDASFLYTKALPCSSPSGTCQVPTAALNAINHTLTANPLSAGCPQAGSAGASSQTSVNCYLASVPNASIADFAAHGLDSGAQFLGGLPASVFGLTPDTGAAFAGVNPLVGSSLMFFPAGRSLYSGLQLSLRSHISAPSRGVRGMNFQASYTHASFRSNVADGLGDQELLPLAADFNHPTTFFGSAAFDRKHHFSLAANLELPIGARVGFIGYFASPLPETLFLPAANQPGEIFRSDITGDGGFGGQSQAGTNSFGDILPGTNIGAFGRSVKPSNLNAAIETYNGSLASTFTPAGRALVAADLLTQGQLQALGGSLPALTPASPGNVGLGWLRSFDLTFSWPLRLGDRFVIEPAVSAFNIFNFANFDGPGNRLGGVLNGAPGEANGTTSANRLANRVAPGSGVFSLGTPRQLELGLRITF
jgi:Carboxypeptidase regulatory-like domain